MMKKIITLLRLIKRNLIPKNKTLRSAVYNWGKLKVHQAEGRQTKSVLGGSTLDLANLEIHTTTISPGIINHPLQAYNDKEELIIMKEGSIKAMIKDTSRILNAGGFALIVAGDSQSFQNISDKPATYYVLSFKSKNPVNIQRGNQEGGSMIKDWNELAVTQTDIGESGQAFDKPTSMFVRFNIIATSLNPGMISHLPHTHRAEEIILVIKGDVQMQIAEGFHNSTAGDIIFLEANVPHALKNTGSEQCSYYSIQWHN